MNPHWLPGLIPWNQEHGETWEQYEQRLFHVFQNEFRESFQYDGKPVHYKRMPYDGIYPEAVSRSCPDCMWSDAIRTTPAHGFRMPNAANASAGPDR